MHIMVVEDDETTLDLIRRYFEKEGMKVTGFTEVEGVVPFVELERPDLCILDVMIGYDNGFELIKEIKAVEDIPVIFVTARSDEFDRIYGIEIGAEDYMTKPFSPRELVVRSKRLLSRVKKSQTQSVLEEAYLLKGENVKVNLKTMEVYDDDILITLTLKEYEVLVFFLRHPRQALTREQIIEEVWGFDALGQTRMVDDIVKRLRKKLTIELKTVWGVGYRYDEKTQ